MSDAILQAQIVAIMARLPMMSYTAGEIAGALDGVHRDDVQAALRRMDDAGRVLMRNGWYRLSEAERRRQEGRG